MAAGLALVLGLLSGCSRSQPPTTPITELPAGSFAAQWRRDLPLPNTTLTALYLNDDKVFAYTADNRCLWISRASGQVLAFTQVTDPRDQLHGPLTLEDRVIFPCTKDLVVYDRDGKLLHKLHLKFAASSRAAGDGQRAFIGVDHTNSGRLTALDTQPQPYTLSPVWELMSFGQISAAPVVHEHQVFCGSRDARVYAVRADDRENLWPGLDKGYFQTGGEIVADLQADAEGVYVASMDGRLYCLNAATGRLRWTYHAGPPLRQFSSPVVTADSVYLYVPGQGVTAINKNEEPKPDQPARPAPASQPTTEPAARDELRAETQEIRKARWIVPAARQVLAADESHVYLAAADGQILAVDKQTGKIQFRSKRKDLKIFATNNSTDNLIFAATPKGQIYAIRPVHLPGAVGEWVMAN
jgi:outer membrane protein assembly factor BamB